MLAIEPEWERESLSWKTSGSGLSGEDAKLEKGSRWEFFLDWAHKLKSCWNRAADVCSWKVNDRTTMETAMADEIA